MKLSAMAGPFVCLRDSGSDFSREIVGALIISLDGALEREELKMVAPFYPP